MARNDPLDSTTVDVPALDEQDAPDLGSSADDDAPRPLTPEQVAALQAALEAEGEPDLSNPYDDVNAAPESEIAESLTAGIPERPRGEVPREKIALAPGVAASADQSADGTQPRQVMAPGREGGGPASSVEPALGRPVSSVEPALGRPVSSVEPALGEHASAAARLQAASPAESTALSIRALSDDEPEGTSGVRAVPIERPSRPAGWIVVLVVGIAIATIVILLLPAGDPDPAVQPRPEPSVAASAAPPVEEPAPVDEAPVDEAPVEASPAPDAPKPLATATARPPTAPPTRRPRPPSPTPDAPKTSEPAPSPDKPPAKPPGGIF